MKITRRQLRQIIKEELGSITVRPRLRGQNDASGYTSGLYEYDDDNSEPMYTEDPRYRDDTDDILRSQAAIGRESTPDEDEIIAMMVGDDDPNVFDLIQSDPALERRENRAHVQAIVDILQNNPSAFTPRVQNDCTGVNAAIKYHNIYEEHDIDLDPLFKTLQHHLHALNPRLF